MLVKFRLPIPEFLKSFRVFSISVDKILKLLRSTDEEMLLIWVSMSPIYCKARHSEHNAVFGYTLNLYLSDDLVVYQGIAIDNAIQMFFFKRLYKLYRAFGIG